MSNEKLTRAGRPNKQGLDYFAHLVNRSDDESILINKYGAIGYAVYYLILEKITSNGYYYELNNKREMFICTTLRIEQEEFKEILNLAIELELFDKDIFTKYNVLTSEKMQQDYLYSAQRRNKIEIIQEYYLISDDYYYGNISKGTDKKLYIRSINVDNNSVNVNSNSAKNNKNTHSNSNTDNNTEINTKNNETINSDSENGKRSKGIVKGTEGKTSPQISNTLSDNEFRALFYNQ